MMQFSSSQWHRLKNILADALEERTTTHRQQFVQHSCADDPLLLHAAESLLSHADDPQAEVASEFDIFAAAAARSLRCETPPPIGHRIGPYEVLSELGRGGMGAVYLARRADGCFDREVAIKAVKRGVDTDEVLWRFQRERKILAALEHPNIARLLDAGTTEDGLPYFVMEYVRGVSLTRHVRSSKLTVRERLALFAKVCHAVEVAHAASIVHRDLKPSNIMVTPEGEPKLLDFGIAKVMASDDASLEETLPEDRRLSPLYTSPEQVRGEMVSPASDVYSLGVVLYEILTGVTPYSTHPGLSSRAAIAKAICDEEPRSPSAVVTTPEERRELNGSFDAIVLLALRKPPAERYASAGELAIDIESYLQGRPVRARSPTLTDRLSRLAKTKANINPILWATAIVLLLGSYLLWFDSSRSSSARSADLVQVNSVPPANSLAALPFSTVGGLKGDPSVAELLHEEVLTSLGKIDALRVTGGTSVAKFVAGQARDVREIGRQLGVAHLVEGTAQRNTSGARLTIRLIETTTGTQEWADQFNVVGGDVSGVAEAIARRLGVSRPVTAEQVQPTTDLQAYDLYLQGKALVDGFMDTPDFRVTLLRAADLLGKATERDPKFMLAWCYLARANSLISGWAFDGSIGREQASQAAAQEALRLAPDSGEAHLALAEVLYRAHRDPDGVRSELEFVKPRLPNSPILYSLLALSARRNANWSEAEDHFARAVSLDPRNRYAVELAADTYMLDRKYSLAKQAYRRALDAGLSSPCFAVRMATVDFAERGETTTLRQALQSTPEEVDVGGAETYLRVMVEVIDGRYEEAKRVLARAKGDEFEGIDMSFYYPRSWLEAFIARAAGDTKAMQEAFARTRVWCEETMKRRAPAPRINLLLAMAEATFGNKKGALQRVELVKQMPVMKSVEAYNRPMILHDMAQIYAWAGEKKLAVDTLREITRVPSYTSYGELKCDPSWKPLRGDPEFESLVQELAPHDN